MKNMKNFNDRLRCRPMPAGRVVLLMLLLASACAREPLPAHKEDERKEARLYIRSCVDGDKALLPDEDKVTDLNLFIFNGSVIEEALYIQGGWLQQIMAGEPVRLNLVSGCRYRFIACANMGYDLRPATLEELMRYRYYLAYPDEYGPGMVMSGISDTRMDGDMSVQLSLRRLMAKVSICIDRSRLHPDVTLQCRELRIGNCPQWATLFSQSAIRGQDDLFRTGFILNRSQCAPLNPYDNSPVSEEVSLYVLENLQGDVPALGTYIEARFDYQSDSLWTLGDNYLIYRFRLEEEGRWDIRRGCHAHIRICPEGDGLGMDNWRVDRSALDYRDDIGWYKVYPSDYIEWRLGEEVTIRAEYFPLKTSCTFREETLYTHGVERGMYSYHLGADGRSITLKALKKGSSMVDIDFGPPINDTHWVLLVCEP